MLIVARFVTGVAAGFMAPAGLSIITTSYAEGPQRNQALLIYAGTAAGGLLARAGRRRPADRDRLALGVLRARDAGDAVLLGAGDPRRPARRAAVRHRRLRPRRRAQRSPARCCCSSSRVVRAPDAGPRSRPPDARAPRCCSPRSSRSSGARPPRSCGSASCARPRSCAPTLGAMLFVGAFVAFQFVAVLYLQELRGWSPIQTGLALLVLGIDAILAPTLTPKLVERFGKVPVIVAGMLLAARRVRAVPAARPGLGLPRRCCRRCCSSAWRSRSRTGR